MKRTLALIFAIVMCLGLFVGCGGDKPQSGTASTDNSTNDTGIFSTDDVKFLDENGESVYRITRPEAAEASIGAFLFKQLKSKLGVNIKNTSDAEDGTDVYEILVGDTNRAETAKAKDYLIKNVSGRYDDYIICTIGKKIVIYSRSDNALQDAMKYFADTYVSTAGVKGGISYTHASEGDFVDASINGVSLGAFVFVKQRFNQSYITQNQMEEANELIVNKTGFKLDIVEDHNAASEYEVIVGDAKRDGVQTIEDRDTYSIIISGKKVYLNGGSPSAKAMAVSEFAKLVSAGAVTDANSVQSASYSATVAGYDPAKWYSTTWADDFDFVEGHETGIDLSKWAFSTEGASAGHNGRNSKRAKTADMLHVNNGMLNFYACYDENSYYGFKLYTKNKMTYRYGVLEMSAILPDSSPNSGFWISLWANSYDPDNPAAYMTEVNVCEMFGNSASEASNLHGWLKNNRLEYYASKWKEEGYAEHWSLDGSHSNQKKYYCPEGKFNDGLHTFTYIWDEDHCGFACDGNVYFMVDLNEKEIWKETFTQHIHIILSQATGFAQQASCPADDDPVWQNSNNFQIDYVHIYQKNDGVSELRFLE